MKWGFVSYALSVRKHCLLTFLWKLKYSDVSLSSQRFLYPFQHAIEPETSRTANSRSSHSATGPLSLTPVLHSVTGSTSRYLARSSSHRSFLSFPFIRSFRGTGKLRNWKFQTGKIDRNITDLT